MPFITTRDSANLYVKDWGTGEAVIFIHGWPLSADSWDPVAFAVAQAGYRTLAYDRRGFGRSEQTWTGYDYDHLADDLADLIQSLGIESATLVGFSMGGGEVARYMSRHQGKGVKAAILISSVVPMLRKTSDHPKGVPEAVLEKIKQGLLHDRAQFYDGFFKDFFGVGLLSKPVSNAYLEWTRSVAMQASLKATLDCVDAFGKTDFRQDLSHFQVPTLVIHGKEDKTVPIDATGRVAAAGVSGAQLRVIEEAPHGLFATHREQLIEALLLFLQQH